MVRFDNQQIEEICKTIITDPKDYYLKMIGSNGIPTDAAGLSYLKQKKSDLEQQLDNVKKAIVIGEMAMLLNSKLYEED